MTVNTYYLTDTARTKNRVRIVDSTGAVTVVGVREDGRAYLGVYHPVDPTLSLEFDDEEIDQRVEVSVFDADDIYDLINVLGEIAESMEPAKT